MKNFFSIIMLALSLTFLGGCGTTPQQSAYTGIVASRVTVDGAWEAFRQQRAVGKVSDDQWREGIKAVQAYKTARNYAIEIARTSDDTTTGTLDKALLAVSKAYEPLFAILVQFVPELQKPNK